MKREKALDKLKFDYMQMQMKFEALEAKATINSQKYRHLKANVAEEDKSIKEAQEELKKEEKQLNQTKLAVANAQSEVTPTLKDLPNLPAASTNGYSQLVQANKTNVKSAAKWEFENI